MPKNSAEVRELEADAYLAVLKAFAIVAPSWERFNILTELEKELNIDSTAKQRLQQESMTDARVLAIKGALAGGGVHRAPSAGGGAKRGGGGGAPKAPRAPSAAAPAKVAGAKRKASTTAAVTTTGVAIDEYIGRRVERFWDEDGGWFPGIVSDYNAADGTHCIVYDMGEDDESFEWFNIRLGSRDEVRVLPGQPVDVRAAIPPAARAAAGKGGDEIAELDRKEAELKAKLAALEDDDDDDDDDDVGGAVDKEAADLEAKEAELKAKLAALEAEGDSDSD